jgi:hypothetical protein
MPSERVEIGNRDRGGNHHADPEKLGNDPAAFLPAGDPPRGPVHPQKEGGSSQHGLPPFQAGRRTFRVIILQTVTMMMQVRGLHRVHARQHADAQKEKDRILNTPRRPERIMLRPVRLAQAGEKKVKGTDRAEDKIAKVISAESADEPRQGQAQLPNLLEWC